MLNNIYSYYGYIKGTEGLREGGNKENESCRLGHLVSFFSFFVFFFFTYTNHLTATINTLKLWKYLWEVMTKRTGPKRRESRRLGHLVSFFFFFRVFFFTYTNHLTATIDTLKLRKYLWEVTTKRTGH